MDWLGDWPLQLQVLDWSAAEFAADVSGGDDTANDLGSNLGDASSHSNKNLPVLLAGGGFRHGQHLAQAFRICQWQHARPRGTDCYLRARRAPHQPDRVRRHGERHRRAP